MLLTEQRAPIANGAVLGKLGPRHLDPDSCAPGPNCLGPNLPRTDNASKNCPIEETLKILEKGSEPSHKIGL